MNVKLLIVIKCYERKEEFYERIYEWDCGCVELHGFRKFRNWDLLGEKEAPCENWGACVSCKGNCICEGPTEGEKLGIFERLKSDVAWAL